MSLAGLRILSLESRRASEIELLIRKQGGEPFLAPSLRERALEDNADAFRLLERLESGALDLLILMTGVGLSFWRDVIGARFPVRRADSALASTKLLVRGPKPTAVLRTIGITPTVTVPEPNTWREVVKVLSTRAERRLAVQEYGRPNDQFIEELEKLGATIETFALYRWELPEDLGPLKEAVQRVAKGEFDVVLFTSSIQLEHLLKIAAEHGLAEQVTSALRDRVTVASVGPIMTEALLEHGISPDIEPASPKMGPLVYATAQEAPAIVASKRKHMNSTAAGL